MSSESSRQPNGCCDGEHHRNHRHRHSSPDEIDAGRHRRTVLDVTGLCCQSEVDLIEEALTHIDGIADHAVNIAAGTLTIYHDGDDERVERLVERLRKVGLKATPRRSVGRSAAVDEGPFSAQFWVIVAGVILGGAGAFLKYAAAMPTAGAVAFGAAVVVGGFFVFRRALAGVRRRQFNIPILVTIAVIGAGIIGEWFEAATVVILFAFAEWLESRSMARARREIGELMRLAPELALKVQPDGSVEEVPVEQIEVGELIRVRPGGKIPVDATIESGRTEIDESTITGESVPVVKSDGDSVYSGTVNGGGAITLRATQPASKSTLAHIIDAIEEARENQSPTEQFIDRFAAVYTPAVVVASALVALIPPLLFGQPWMDWFYRGLVFLVIACPCALVISTPIANVAGLARSAREGVLVKGGKFLELLGKLEAVAFDKTGTVTVGEPRLEQIIATGDFSEDELLIAAARAEADSEHHIGRAIVHAARHRFEPGDYIGRATNIRATTGRGIEANVDTDGLPPAIADSETTTVRVGTIEWLRDCDMQIPDELQEQFDTIHADGRSVVGVAVGDRVAGLIGLRDTVRSEAPAALEALRKRGVDEAFLITGDNATTARVVASDIGIDDDAIAARLLPTEKVDHIERLRADHEHIAMVGDGVNDAPALAASSVGIAMGAAGTDVALESADVALMGDDLRRISRAIGIGRKTTRVIYQNIAIALGLKAIFLVLAVMGIATLWMAIAADMGATLIVVFNAIRLLREPSEPEETPAPKGQHTPQVVQA